MRSTSYPSRRNTLKPNISTRLAAAPEAPPDVGIEVAAETMNARLQPMRRRKAPIVAWRTRNEDLDWQRRTQAVFPTGCAPLSHGVVCRRRAARSGEPEVAT